VQLDRGRVLQLLELLRGSTAAELTVREGDLRVRLVRPVAASTAASLPPAAETAGRGEAVAGALAAAEAGPAAAAASATAAEPALVTVTSHLVGLFYRGREPGATPFVGVGEVVEEGQVLGLVEVLRKPVEVTSPVAGTVVGVVPEEGAAVQYGDPLFTIRP
jgi:biotin carboxyl carrier protein